MTSADNNTTHELVLERTLAAPRMAVWQCWTEPALLGQWYCPKPWFVKDVTIDVRTGGTCRMTMCGPNGESFPNQGVYLQVEHGKRLVFTDAFSSGWIPSGKAFMVADITLADAPGGGTFYKAVARHWNAEDRAAHEKMGFQDGWGTAADQLAVLAATL